MESPATTAAATDQATKPPPLALPLVPYPRVVLVQTFGWNSHRRGPDGASFWRRLADRAGEIAETTGATHAWLPPPSASVAPEGYLPGQLYDCNSAYGTAEELKACCAALRAAGIRPVCDVVINHRCADRQDEQGRYNLYEDTAADESTREEEGGSGRDSRGNNNNNNNSSSRQNRRRIDWGRWAIAGNDPHFGGRGNPDTGADFGGAPDLDHANPELREALVEWLLWLREEFGFDGWRLDFAKGYAAKYSGEYIRRTLPLSGDRSGGQGEGSGDGDSNKGDEDDDARPFCVGELWCDLAWAGDGKPAENQDPARQSLCDWIDGCRSAGGDAAAFDFVTKGVLQSALASGELWRLRDASGKPPGLAGWWPRRAALFVESHDTGSSQRHWPCPSQCLQAAHAYVLTHPGVPCLFAEHCLDAGLHLGPAVPEAEAQALRAAITALLAVRRAVGVGADSNLEILAAEEGLYVADVCGGGGGGAGSGGRRRLRVKLGARMEMGALLPQEAEGWSLAASGEGFAVWTNLQGGGG